MESEGLALPEGVEIERGLMLPIDEVRMNPKNPRVHVKEAVQRLVKMVAEVGYIDPVIVDEDGVLLAGHKRKLAGQAMGMMELPAVRVSGLTPTQKTAVLIGNNQHTLSSGWDYELLGEQIFDLSGLEDFDLDALGFAEYEVKGFLADGFDSDKEENQGKLGEIDPKLVKCPECGHEFDSRSEN